MDKSQIIKDSRKKIKPVKGDEDKEVDFPFKNSYPLIGNFFFQIIVLTVEIDPSLKAPLNAKIVGRYTKLKYGSGGSKGTLKRTMEKKVESKAKRCKVATPVMKTPTQEISEEESSTQEDEHGHLTHEQILEQQWKDKMERIRRNKEKALIKLNKKEFD